MQHQLEALEQCIAHRSRQRFEAREQCLFAWLLRNGIWIEELIGVAESEASCELFGILKRPDEKYVTERAYDNPKFVEDLVRDVAKRLNDDERIAAYVVEAENFESIHNHSAYALIEKDKDEVVGL